MKFKFSADSHDWMMFGIYAVILLYFVAIAILNISSFANATSMETMFHGFNPLPAFTGAYIGYTIFFWIVALIASIFTVSDRFFDMDSGIGISFSRKRKNGFSRWLQPNELKKEKDIEGVRVEQLDADAGGVPLINNGRKIWVDNGEGHTLIMGSSGSGKTQMIVVPMVKSLAKHNESMIINDPKGEIYEKTSKMLKERGYKIVVLNFRNPSQGSAWNPLTLPYKYYKGGNKDKANELIDDLALNILYDETASKQDPFWEKTSADYFSGICLGLFDDAKEDEINLNSVNMFTTVGEEKSGPRTTYVQEYFGYKPPSSPANVSASSTLIAPEETKGSILSVFKQKLRLFASRENISEMLSHSDFDFDEIGSQKTAIFIIVHDEKTTYHSLVTIFVKQCYEALIDYAQKNNGRLPYRTNFILDEFANMPPLKDVSTMVTAARSRNMRFTFIIQNFAQLSEVYGEHIGNTIKGNAMNIIYLISTELAALEEISKMCGEIKVKTGKDGKEKEENRPLVSVSDLQKMQMGEIILLRQRLDPFKTKLKMDWEMSWPEMYKTQDSKDAVYPSRETEEVHVFDLKGFVKAKKEEKINNLLNGQMSKTSMNMSGVNGFGAIGHAPMPNKIDYNALVKKIDDRIKQLEQEEKNKKQVLDSNKAVVKPSVPATPVGVREIGKKIDNDFAAKITERVNSKITSPASVNQSQLNNVPPTPGASAMPQAPVNTKPSNYVTDDQFFDNFFADDE